MEQEEGVRSHGARGRGQEFWSKRKGSGIKEQEEGILEQEEGILEQEE